MTYDSLVAWGWTDSFENAFDAANHPGQVPARVVEELRDAYLVQTEQGERQASISGRLRHEAHDATSFPAVGDWVRIKDQPLEQQDSATILSVVPRHSKLSRKSSGAENTEQLIAANLDTVFITIAMGSPFNPNRLDRYLSMIAGSGATPVMLLTKADLATAASVSEHTVRLAALRLPVCLVSVTAGTGLASLAPFIGIGQTIALIGSSGAGKSSLINHLLGTDRQTVRAVRDGDARGRHTTTTRRMLRLPGGALLIDTPGMRELQSWESTGVAETFSDITALIAECRFDNCKHAADAGCAIHAAIADGRLEAARYAHYRKLNEENASLAAHQEAVAKQKATQKFRRARDAS